MGLKHYRALCDAPLFAKRERAFILNPVAAKALAVLRKKRPSFTFCTQNSATTICVCLQRPDDIMLRSMPALVVVTKS